jgi:hypothetical protein
MAEGSVPIRESVGAALRFARDNLRFIVILSALGAAATTLVSGLGLIVTQPRLLAGVASTLIQAFTYAAFISAALLSAAAVRARWASDGGRVFAAMVVIGFFLFILMFVVTIPVLIALFVGPLAPYVADLQNAGSDQARVLSIMTRFAEENPGVLLAVTLFYCVLWLLVTSRLYLAAPATVDQERILTFETWSWTKGAMLRIAGARLLLLLPANILAGALGHLAGRLVGLDSFDPATVVAAATSNQAGYLAYIFVAGFISFALYSSLEAGLSSYLYRGLKPAQAAPAA